MEKLETEHKIAHIEFRSVIKGSTTKAEDQILEILDTLDQDGKIPFEISMDRSKHEARAVLSFVIRQVLGSQFKLVKFEESF